MHNQFEPMNEAGTIAYFWKHFGEFWEPVVVGTAFPDAVLRYQEQTYRVEFEYLSSNFVVYEHDMQGCDLIICWRNDIPDFEFPCMELCSGSHWEPTLLTAERRELLHWKYRAKFLESLRLAKEQMAPTSRREKYNSMPLERKEELMENVLKEHPKGLTVRQLVGKLAFGKTTVLYVSRRLINQGKARVEKDSTNSRFLYYPVQ